MSAAPVRSSAGGLPCANTPKSACGGSAEIELSRGFVAIVDADIKEWLLQWSWLAIGSAPRRPYAGTRVRVGGVQQRVLMHRLIAGARSGQVVDHINGDTLDNRVANLRVCSQKQNTRNRKAHAGRKYKGVYERDGRWLARIMVDGKAIDIGYYDSEITAAAAYDDSAKTYFGEFARLNFDPARDWIFPFDFSQRPRGRPRRERAPLAA